MNSLPKTVTRQLRDCDLNPGPSAFELTLNMYLTTTTPVQRPQDNLGISRYQKDKTSLDLDEARNGGVLGWQWHQLDHMQTICTSL